MPKVGQTLINKYSGDTFEFIETGESTNGERVKLKITLNSKGRTVDDHIHLEQDETFEVLSGTLTYFLKGETHKITAGETVVLPRKVAHNHYNTSDEPLTYYQTITPAFDVDYFIENLSGLINDDKLNNGKLPFLQAMVTGKYLESPSRLANIPLGLQNVLINILGPTARLFGYRALYKKYTGIEK